MTEYALSLQYLGIIVKYFNVHFSPINLLPGIFVPKYINHKDQTKCLWHIKKIVRLALHCLTLLVYMVGRTIRKTITKLRSNWYGMVMVRTNVQEFLQNILPPQINILGVLKSFNLKTQFMDCDILIFQFLFWISVCSD